MKRVVAAAVVRAALIPAALVLAALVAPAARAAADGSAAPTGSVTPASPVNLLAQTPWVDTKGDFQLRVSFSPVQPGDQVEVAVFNQIHTRTDFELAAKGTIQQYAFYRQTVPVTALAPDPAGGYAIDLPVDQAAAPNAPFPEVQLNQEQNGVQAVQVQLVGPLGGRKGDPLTTFLTYSQGTAKTQGYAPLATAVVLPYASTPVVGSEGQVEPPVASEAVRLDKLAKALNSDTSVHLSLLSSPATLAALQVGSARSSADADAVGNLGGAPGGGLMQLLPSTWSPVPLGDLTRVGLSSEIGPQISAAGQTVNAVLGSTPGARTWVVNGPVDDAGLQAIAARGGTQLVVPDTDLTGLSQEITTTFAHPTQLGSSPVTVFAADAGLANDFTRPVPPVLAANIMLADMAMIFTEAPGDHYDRGVVAMPPPGSVLDPTLVSTLLSGLAGDPVINPVTADGLFAAAGTTRGTRYLASPDPSLSDAASALSARRLDIVNARAGLAELASVLPTQSAQLTTLESQLLLAESETITPGERASVLAAIAHATSVLNNAVSLPPSTSITLTSTQGQIPITILAAGNLHPRVELRLRSSRLIFLTFKPQEGTCTVPEPAEEDCVLTLKTQNTTLKVPVETRSSGVFPLDVKLTPPGSLTPVLSHDQDTVRSTAVSKVAIVLIVMALAGLGFWWVRDIRRGRRPKGMLPSPNDPGPDPDADPDGDAGDPYLDDFFRRPPPTYGGEAMSPSGLAAGPTATTDRYGSGRETRE